MRKLASVLGLVLIAMAMPASAGEYSHGSGYSFSLPDDWSVEEQGGILIGSDPSQEVALLAIVPQSTTPKEIVAELGKVVVELVKEVKPAGTPEQTEINAIDALVARATGKTAGDSTPVEIGIAIYMKDGTALALIILAEAAKAPAHEASIAAIIQSVNKQ